MLEARRSWFVIFVEVLHEPPWIDYGEKYLGGHQMFTLVIRMLYRADLVNPRVPMIHSDLSKRSTIYTIMNFISSKI